MGLFNLFKSDVKPAEHDEKTNAQLTGRSAQAAATRSKHFSPPPPPGIAVWREMRKDPTLALARAIANAPIRNTNVAVVGSEDAPEEWTELIRSFVNRCWSQFVADSLFSRDYGFQPFEIVYTVKDDLVTIDNLKMLLADITQPVLDKHGDYLGLVNGAKHAQQGDLKSIAERNGVTVLSLAKSLWITNQKEGDDFYGESVMERARKSWHDYNELRKKENTYATTVAAPIPFVRYPDGQVQDETGSEKPGYEMAATLIKSLSNAQGVAIPSLNAQWVERQLEFSAAQKMPPAWEIGFFETQNHGTELLEMERARDKDKFRAWLVPERAGLEGEFGTKAEAETHGSLVLTIADLFMSDLVEMANRQLVDTLLFLNFGEEAVGEVQIKVEQQNPKQMELLRELIKGLFGAPINVDMFEDTANVRTIFELLGIPLREDVDDVIGGDDEEEDEPPPRMQPPVEEEEEEEELSFKAPAEGELRQYLGRAFRYTQGEWIEEGN